MTEDEASPTLPKVWVGGKTFAPWPDFMVRALNDYQQNGEMHPFTCPDCRANLTAFMNGWVCGTERCDYTQFWAYNFMAAPR